MTLTLLVVAGLGSASGLVITAPVSKRLVEGHTVYARIESLNVAPNVSRFATAISVLVRENTVSEWSIRFPGVLWFNDQYLVAPGSNTCGIISGDCAATNITRSPCSGAVVVTNAGDPAPNGLTGADQNVSNFTGTYVESYLVTDPNNHNWTVDKWTYDVMGVERPMWAVALLGNKAESRRAVKDDGVCNSNPYGDSATSAPCGKGCKNLQYNAVLFMYLDDLDVADTPKNHTWGSADMNNDVSGCSDQTSGQYKQNWPCPASDDTRQGNSHSHANNATALKCDSGKVHELNKGCQLAYRPGASIHGGSADCDPGHDSTPDMDYRCHATRDVSVWYGVAPHPMARNFVLNDTEGAGAPYMCEKGPQYYDPDTGPATSPEYPPVNDNCLT